MTLPGGESFLFGSQPPLQVRQLAEPEFGSLVEVVVPLGLLSLLPDVLNLLA
jgi:hypothetical protein